MKRMASLQQNVYKLFMVSVSGEGHSKKFLAV